MPRVELAELLSAGAHFGHLTRRWNPKMKPYIFMERNGIHIIDLKKTQQQIEDAATAISNLVAEGKKILYVGTKKQAKEVIEADARRGQQHFATDRWLGGMLTNFTTIRKSVKRLTNIEKMETDGTFDKITKKEKLFLSREKEKLQKSLSGIVDMTRLPGALFVVDVKKEAIAVQEANRLGIPVFAIVDTNCDPDGIDHIIPANDDALKSIQLISRVITDAVVEGNARKVETAPEAEEIEKQEKTEKTERRERKHRRSHQETDKS
ncbi:MAG: 30S ribosomal protein S2 [Bacteroidota bacterium]